MARFERFASPNERRTISREDLGFYNAVLVGGIYEIEDPDLDTSAALTTWAPPLKSCVEKYPILNVVVRDPRTEKPFYERVAEMDLRNHIHILEEEEESHKIETHADDNDRAVLERVIPNIIDKPWVPNIPAWSITVVPLRRQQRESSSQRKQQTIQQRCFVSFTFSHALGDANNGLIFHRSLLNALAHHHQKQPSPSSLPHSFSFPPSNQLPPLPPPFDTPQRLPISWTYLLGPLLAVLLPKFLCRYLGLRATAVTTDSGTWTGSPMFSSSSSSSSSPSSPEKTNFQLIEFPPSVISSALRACRSRDKTVKLTSVLHQLINRSLSSALMRRGYYCKPSSSSSSSSSSCEEGNKIITNLVSGTALNMRRASGFPPDEMGLFVSGHYEMHHHPLTSSPSSSSSSSSSLSSSSSPLPQSSWHLASEMTSRLALAATRLKDQPIGLLRYAPSIRNWWVGKLGQERDASYEVSNLVVFDGEPSSARDEEEKGGKRRNARIVKAVFAQPATPVSAPIVFSVVGIKGGGVMMACRWQGGALGLGCGGGGEEEEEGKEKEKEFVAEVCEGVRLGMENLV